MNWLSFFRIFYLLLWRDLRHVKTHFHDYIIDALLWTSTNVLIAAYILPLLGMHNSYGSFMLVGTMISMCLFYAINKSNTIVVDFEGTKSISYDLTLPVPAWIIFSKMAITIALQSALINILSLPIGKLLLGSHFPLHTVKILPSISIFVLINIFFGFFALWVASWVTYASSFPHVWMRFILPLWSFGGYQFSWATLKNTYPLLAFINLANPLVYTFEGLRSAVLGTSALPFSLSVCALILFTVLLWIHTLFMLKKRLDYV